MITSSLSLTNWVVRIDPASGRLLGRIDFTGLLPSGTSADVLNGIAFDMATGHLVVTGKLWPTLFEVEVTGNAPPVASNQSIATAEDIATGVTLSATDLDGDPLTFVVVSGPAHGALSGTPPFLVYTPAPNFNGVDSFAFSASDPLSTSNVATVSITVSPVNDPPVAVNDTYALSANATLSVAAPGVLANDSDVDGDPLTVTLVTAPAHGAVTLSANGAFSYTPAANYAGTDTFTYSVRDPSLSSALATVSLSVSGATLVTSTNTIGFGNQAVGTTSSAKSIVLINNGTTAAALTSVSISGTNAGDFSQTNGCGVSVPAGGSCTIAVAFRPTATGSRKAALVISSTGTANPLTVSLSGTGKKAGH